MRQQLLRQLLPLGQGAFPPLAATSSLKATTSGLQGAAFSSSSLQGQREERDDGVRGSPVLAPSPKLLQLAGLVNSPMPSVNRASPFGSFASGPVLGSARSLSTMVGSKSRKPALPLLPGMGPAAPARTYYTEGEIFGTTFMYTTNMMFWAGIVGAVAFRRNLIILLLSAETVMLACNMNFLFAAAYLNDITGAIMSITITTIAACETAIGLALCVAYFHMRSATDVEALNLLK